MLRTDSSVSGPGVEGPYQSTETERRSLKRKIRRWAIPDQDTFPRFEACDAVERFYLEAFESFRVTSTYGK